MPELEIPFAATHAGIVITDYASTEYRRLKKKTSFMTFAVSVGTIFYHLVILISSIAVLVYTYRTYLVIFSVLTLFRAMISLYSIIALLLLLFTWIVKKSEMFKFTEHEYFGLFSSLCLLHVYLLSVLEFIYLVLSTLIIIVFFFSIAEIVESKITSIVFFFNLAIVCLNWVFKCLGCCYEIFFALSYVYLLVRLFLYLGEEGLETRG